MSVASVHARAFEGHDVVSIAHQQNRAVPELSVVVPTYNEAKNVALIVDALDCVLRGISWEVLFVDDDSADGTVGEVYCQPALNFDLCPACKIDPTPEALKVAACARCAGASVGW